MGKNQRKYHEKYIENIGKNSMKILTKIQRKNLEKSIKI